MATFPHRLDRTLDYTIIGVVIAFCIIFSPLMLIGWAVVKIINWWVS